MTDRHSPDFEEFVEKIREMMSAQKSAVNRAHEWGTAEARKKETQAGDEYPAQHSIEQRDRGGSPLTVDEWLDKMNDQLAAIRELAVKE
jgi:hypothetical protein